MDFQKIFDDAWGIASLKLAVMRKVGADKEALHPALLIMAFSAIAAGLGLFILPPSIGSFITYRIGLIDVLSQGLVIFAFSVASLYLAGYLAENMFKAKVDMQHYVRVLGYGSIVGFLAIVPALGVIGTIWQFVIMWKYLREVGKMEVGAIILLLILQAIIMGAAASYYTFL